MCGRFTPVSVAEMRRAALEIQRDAQSRQLRLPLAGVDDARQLNTPVGARQGGEQFETAPDVFPGDIAPVIAMGHTRMGIARLAWGFQEPWHAGPLFNARIEKAAAEGSVWHEAFLRRRCIIVARAFFERSEYETVPSPRTGKPVKRVYRFKPADSSGGALLYFAGLYQQGRFTMLTCEPDVQVGRVHSRMPLLLGARQCAPWLMGGAVHPSGQPLMSSVAER